MSVVGDICLFRVGPGYSGLLGGECFFGVMYCEWYGEFVEFSVVVAGHSHCLRPFPLCPNCSIWNVIIIHYSGDQGRSVLVTIPARLEDNAK